MKSDSGIKKDLYQYCQQFLEGQLQTICNAMDEIQQALLTETKSSAGDKHETGRAMLQLELEKAGNQLKEMLNERTKFSKINPLNASNIIGLGSAVYTSQHNYYLAISAGKIKLGEEVFYAISPQTPMGQLLLSKKMGETIGFRNQTFTIEKVI